MGKYLIVGLGNIGADYVGTRHNIGFDVVDLLARKNGVTFRLDRLAEVTEIKWKGQIFVCLKPTTYVNLSGKAVKYWMDKEKIAIDHVLIILDDLALPISKWRLRPGGSDGGHNGLKSIQESLSSIEYPRLRLGIGNNFPKGKQPEFVLGRWTEAELAVVNAKVERSVELIETFATSGIERTMSQYNKLDFGL